MTDYLSFKNRLIKRYRHFERWAKKEDIEAFRIYDRDIPSFPFAIDKYASFINLQEYDTHWQITPLEYRRWIDEVKNIISEVLAISKDAIYLKTRKKQAGKSQYIQLDRSGDFFQISEKGRCFWINLKDYLDSGLFLDHRPMRSFIAEAVKKSNFTSLLNLFCYTASFTVYAATAQTRLTSESVDLSKTYLNWAQRNLTLNNLNLHQHRLIESDVFDYLQKSCVAQKTFEVIILDPPSFSNSKKTNYVFDIQKIHANLIIQAMKLLKKNGFLLFSTNLRSFKLEKALFECFLIENITKKSIPFDFGSNLKIHHCWIFRHKSKAIV